MKSSIVIAFLFMLFKSNLGFSQVTFDSTYDAGGYEGIFTVLPLQNSYWTALDIGAFPAQFQLKKVDNLGNSIISKTFIDSLKYILIYSLILSNDSNMIMGCYSSYYGTSSRTVFIAKINLIGDTVWTKTIAAPFGKKYYGQYLIETSDRGFLISGEVTDSLITDGDLFILKTDSAGNYQWMNAFGGIRFESAYSSVETPDGGFLTLGWTRSFGFGSANNRDIYLVKTDSLGGFMWQKTYGDANQQSGVGLTSTSDGNYLISTGWYDINSPLSYGEIIKIDVAGNVIWDKQYGNGDANGFIWSREISNTDIVSVSGYTNLNGFDDGWVVRSDSAGNEKWQRRYRYGNSYCYFRDVQETLDGGIICAGFVFEGASGNQDGWLVKLDSSGCLSAGNCGESTGLFEAPAVSLYHTTISPNPVKDQAIVKVDGLPSRLLNESYKLNVFDLTGRIVQSAPTGFLIGDDWIECIFKTGELGIGVYLLEVCTYDGERLGTLKLVIE